MMPPGVGNPIYSPFPHLPTCNIMEDFHLLHSQGLLEVLPTTIEYEACFGKLPDWQGTHWCHYQSASMGRQHFWSSLLDTG